MEKKQEGNRIIKGSVRPWYRWHRRIAIVAAFFVIILAVTGIILNHNIALGINKDFITSEWLLDWYGYDSKAAYAKEILTVDKVILDIHTGRFFGKFGTLVMDASAIALLILSFTGIYMWYRRVPVKNSKNK